MEKHKNAVAGLSRLRKGYPRWDSLAVCRGGRFTGAGKLHQHREALAASPRKRRFAGLHLHTQTPLETVPQTIKRINEKTNFTINLSTDSLKEADQKADLKIGPVTVVVPSHTTLATTTPKGRTVMVCPATYNPQVNCQNCRLCADSKRSFLVGFPAHGTKQKLINERIKNRQGEAADSNGV